MIESKRGKKTSSEKVAEVISKKIENPDLSLRDLEKETWVNYRTNWRIIKEDMSQVVTKTENASKLLDMSLEIVNNGVSIINDEIKALKLKEWSLKINSLNDLKQLSWTIEENFKRSQLLQDKPTDKIEVNNLKGISTEELLKRLHEDKK